MHGLPQNVSELGRRKASREPGRLTHERYINFNLVVKRARDLTDTHFHLEFTVKVDIQIVDCAAAVIVLVCRNLTIVCLIISISSNYCRLQILTTFGMWGGPLHGHVTYV